MNIMAHDSLNPDNDPFGPPPVSTVVHCIHCGEEYDSYKIQWRIERDDDGTQHGFWCCPIAGCDGKGFGFDIFPVDPDYRDENGELMWSGDEEEDDDDEDDFDFGDALEFTDVEIESPSVSDGRPGESAGGHSEDVPY
jgi:hypothetical protein